MKIKSKSVSGTLFDDLLVLVALAIPILLFIFMSLVIAREQEIRVDLSAEGFKFFYEMFKLPLLVLALIVPAMAVAIANHRSKQAHNQLEVANQNLMETRSQNSFQNYYKHKDLFFEHMNKFSINSQVKFFMLEVLYKLIYPNNSPNNLDIMRVKISKSDDYFYGVINSYEDIRRKVIELGVIGGSESSKISIVYQDIIALTNKLKIIVEGPDLIVLNENYNGVSILYSDDNPLLQLDLIEQLLKSLAYFMDNEDVRILKVPNLPKDIVNDFVEFIGHSIELEGVV